MFVLGSEWQRVGDLPVFLPPPADGCSSLGQPRVVVASLVNTQSQVPG